MEKIEALQNLFKSWRKPQENPLEKYKNHRLENFSGAVSLYELLHSFEIFFVCYDEPNRKKNWRRVKNFFPHAQKVEGVEGFDRALKTCAEQSTTQHFFVIDGDNFVLEEKINQPLLINKNLNDHVLSWSAQNSVNGLSYGNGGLKLWPKDVALKIRSHENAQSKDDPTDYCFLARYFMIDNYLTVTHVNETAFQAFRAGFREGVKMSLVWGEQQKLDKENYEKLLGPENRQRLWVWCNIGADVKNGLWCIYGARLGLKMNLIDGFNISLINSYDWFEEFWLGRVSGQFRISKPEAFKYSGSNEELYREIKKTGEALSEKLPIEMKLYNANESEEFKESFINPPREGLLFTPQSKK